MRSSNNIKTGGGMSSMTDLVFLLLIFFIILSTLAKNSTPASFPQGQATTTVNKETKTTKVKILDNGKVLINNKPTTLEDIEMMITHELTEDKVIEIDGSREAPYESVHKVLIVADEIEGVKVVLL